MTNRKQRCELAKKINTPQKLERLCDEIVLEKTKEIRENYQKKLVDYIEVFVVMMCYVLDLEDIEKDKIPQIASRVLFNIDSFRTGELQPSDYDIIKKEVQDMGVKL